MPKLKKLNLTRRWMTARPGSVLILVIALLVLLALIGTAYLSSTQTERYTSHQNSINTEADLLIQGMAQSVEGEIVNSLFANTSTGLQYRPPSQEMPSAAGTAPAQSRYYNYDCAVPDSSMTQTTDPDPADKFLADRLPVIPTSNVPTWNTISWPLFQDATGGYSFDSPIGASIQLGAAHNKIAVDFQPTDKQVTASDGTVTDLPAMNVMLTGAINSIPTLANGSAFTNVNQFLAADADGDGIADSCFTKVPVGQMNGITYYVATRIIDGNSAINAASARSQGPDTPTGVNSPINYGFFRANTGLKELFNSTPVGGTTAQNEIDALDNYRVATGNAAATQYPPAVTATPVINPAPVPDSGWTTPPANFGWYSFGDAMENQLAPPGESRFVCHRSLKHV